MSDKGPSSADCPPLTRQIKPCLIVFDPADQWTDVEGALPCHLLPIDELRELSSEKNGKLLAIRTRECRLVDCSVLLALPPEGGFEQGHSRFLKDTLAASHGSALLLVLAFADEEELCGGGYHRSEPGYITLFEEIKREYGTSPLVIPRKSMSDLASEFRDRLGRTCFQSNLLKAHMARKDRVSWIADKHVLELGAKPPSGLCEVYELILSAKRAGVLLKAARELRLLSRKVQSDLDKAVSHWDTLALTCQDACAKVARKVDYFSMTAETLFTDEGEIAEIRKILEMEWKSTPNQSLAEWRDDALNMLQTSEIVLPVVGVFSSGKTTLINMILGSTKKGRELLRTSITHNTALLCSFHSKKPNEPNKAVFTWRSNLPPIRLVSCDLGKDDLKRTHPVGLLSVSPRAIRAFHNFISSGTLGRVEASVTWREPSRDPSKDVTLRRTRAKNTREVSELFDCLLDLIGTSQAETERLGFERIEIKRIPIEVSLTGTVVEAKNRTNQHLLEMDEDWDWFQGSAYEENGVSKRIVGFAESPEAEYLISQCDIFLDHPLFMQINLVDTPGLNSITEHHDRITEVCIREGHCFLFMAKLAEAAGHKDTERLLKVINETLATAGITSNQAERVFLVLNWFKEQAGARTEEQARDRIIEFEALARQHLNTKQPNLFVVDLSRRSERAETLLGKPSLGRLLRDLKSYIADKGTADRFSTLRERLNRSWDEWNKALKRKQQIIDGERDPNPDYKKLGEFQRRFAENGEFYLELKGFISSKIDHLQGIFDVLARRLDELDKKDEFEDFISSGSQQMELFNSTRVELGKELASQVSSRLNRMLSNLLSERFVISAQTATLNSVEPLPSDTFRRRLRSAVDKWPSVYIPILYSPGKERRKEFENDFFSEDIRNRLRTAITRLKSSYFTELERVCAGILRALDERTDEVRLAMGKRDSASNELAVELNARGQFEPIVKKMLKALKRTC